MEKNNDKSKIINKEIIEEEYMLGRDYYNKLNELAKKEIVKKYE